MAEEKTQDEASEKTQPRRLSRTEWTTWTLGIGNFLLVSVLGAYTSWRTQDLESKLSTVQTAAQYIEIVADDAAPDYAKGMALNAIFNQGLVSRDQLLDAAYRIEDDSLERTMVGQIFYEIANIEERLQSPFGYVEDVKARRTEDGGLELVVRGWGVDNRGWIPAEPDGRDLYLVVELDDELSCSFPIAEGVDCDVTFGPRPDISAAFSKYPQSGSGGFELSLPVTDGEPASRHLVIALRDQDHRGRILYSRCIAFAGLDPLKAGRERRLSESRYDDSCNLPESSAAA